MGHFLVLLFFLAPPIAAFGSESHFYDFDDQKGCGNPKSPEQLAREYCRLFELTPLLKQDETAGKAKAECVSFYQNTAETANLVCSYRINAALYSARYQRAMEEAESAQKGLIESIGGVHSDARKFHSKLLDRLQEKFDRTESRSKAYGDTLANLAGAAGRTSVNESVCLTPPSSVPGALLTGVLVTALEDKKKTFDTLMETINSLGNHADQASKAENAAAYELSDAGGDLGRIVPGAPGKAGPRSRGMPGEEVSKPEGLLSQLVQRNTTAAFNRNVTGPTVRMLNPNAHPLTAGLMGANVNLLFRLLSKGRLDAIDYVSSGASLLAGLKATAAKAHLLVTAVQTVEFAVRRYQYDTYVGRLHADFSVGFLKTHPQASSVQVAEAFKKRTKGKHCQGP